MGVPRWDQLQWRNLTQRSVKEMHGNYLGIDVGTQSVKALCYDAVAAKVVAVSNSPLELVSADDGTREQSAAWWLAALQDCMEQIDPAVRRSIAAIGVSGQQHGFVPLDRDGEVLAPVKLWCDTSTVLECGQITRELGGVDRCIAEVGNPILPGYTASKILYLKKHSPELYAQLCTILLPHDYINYYLTGERVMECGDASGTGLLDIRERSWSQKAIRALDADRDLLECLPPLVSPGAAIGQLRREAAELLGLPAGIPVSAGGGDNMMAAVGTGNVAEGTLTVSLGTSGTLFAHSDTPVVDDSGTIAAFCSSTGGWLPLLCTMNCTVSTELTRNVFQLPVAELNQRVASAPVGSGGVVTIPFFNGERSPNLPAAKGCVLGLDSENYQADNLLRSAMESAVYGLRAGLDRLREKGCSVESIRLTGGGSRSTVWSQMVADVFNRPVQIQTHDEGAALGAALHAMWMHSGEDIVSIVSEHLSIDEERSCVPDVEVAGQYQGFYNNYLRHVAAIAPLYA